MSQHFSIAITLWFCTFVSQLSAQIYIGSEECGKCHPEKYDVWQKSGHHHTIKQISGTEPLYPFEYHPGIPNIPNPPKVFGDQLNWSDINYVIGGFYWKANFINQDFYFITGEEGDSTQWNIQNQEWTKYYPEKLTLNECVRCHTTGYDSSGGTWAEDGVGCEACHGPSS